MLKTHKKMMVIDVQGSVHVRYSSFADQLYHCFQEPKQSYVLGYVSGFGFGDSI